MINYKQKEAVLEWAASFVLGFVIQFLNDK